jgi:hypothetical protein
MTDWSEVSAIATAIYGGATLLLVVQIWRDRIQRDKHFGTEVNNRKLDALHNAFYEAWGYWEAHTRVSLENKGDAGQAGKLFVALIRLECQLRLNGYKSQADGVGVAIRANLHAVVEPLADAGIAIGLFPPEFGQVKVLFDE